MELNPLVVMTEQFDGTGLVFNPESNWAMSLNPTGVFLWKKLKAGASETELIAAVIEHYAGIDQAQATADVRAFLEKLRQRALLNGE